MSFFTTETVSADATSGSPDILTRMRHREIDGVVIKGVYSPATCEQVCAELDSNAAGLVRTDFPAKFAAFFYGINLNLAHPDLKDYFAEVPRFRAGLATLGGGTLDLQARLTGLMSAFDGGRPYGPAPGPNPQTEYMFTTIRAHLPGGYIPAHYDDEQAARPTYRYLLSLIHLRLFSFVLAFSKPEDGGALEIYNAHPAQEGQRIAEGDRSAARPDTETMESVSFRLDPGDMVLFNSGYFLHRVTPVVGGKTRWTACSFMAEARTGDRIFCWG